MKLSKHVIEEAKNALAQNSELPHQLKSAPEYYVSEVTDQSIIAFSSLFHGDKAYKIGVTDPNHQTLSS